MNKRELFPADDDSGEAAIRRMIALSRSEIAENVDAIVALTHHGAPEVRSEAVSALFVRGKRYELHALAARTLSRDADEGVRAAAALGLAAISSPATRIEDTKLLLRAVRNTHESGEVRRCAYEALLLMYARTDFPSSLTVFDPSEHIDWGWLEGVEDEVRE